MSERIPVEVKNYYAPVDHRYLMRFSPRHKNGLAMAIQDTRERRRIEDALWESETRFRAFAKASRGSDLASGFERRPSVSESALSGIPGQAIKDETGTGLHAVVHPEDLRNYVRPLDTAVRQHARLLARVRIRRKDGEWCFLESSALPWVTAEGNYAGQVGISIEINEAVESSP